MANYQSSYTGAEIDSAIGKVINGQAGGLTNEAKAALLACLEKVAWVDEHGQDYYDALYNALYPPANLLSISCVYTQSGTVFDTATLDSLKEDLVVTAHYDDTSTQIVTTYLLSGTLTEGTSTITVLYGGKSTTFTVTVTEWEPITQSITWSGVGVDKTSSIIDATQYDAYFELPFIEGSPLIMEGSTASDGAFKAFDTYLYSDSEGTTLVGRYWTDSGEIKESGRGSTQAPTYAFDTKIKIAPQGYYAKIVLNKATSFESNANFMEYLGANGNEVTLE